MCHPVTAPQAVAAPRLYAPAPDAIFRPDGSILGVRPPQLPDRGPAAPVPSGAGPPSTAAGA